MNRDQYLSQTEACRMYHLSPKKFKKLIEGVETINNPVTMYTQEGIPYEITTIYVRKIDFIKIMII